MNITQQQIEQSREWEQRFAEGKCNLNEALYMCMASGAPISTYMRQQYDKAVSDYCEGKHKDLAEAFGIEMKQGAKRAMKTLDLQRKVAVVVEIYSEQGFPKTNPSHYDGTAFHKAADVLHKSPSHVYDLYREAQKQLN